MLARTDITISIGIDANEPIPTICPESPCPTVFPTVTPNQTAPPPVVTPAQGFPIGSPLAGAPVPAGSFFIPAGAPLANPARSSRIRGLGSRAATALTMRCRSTSGAGSATASSSRRLHMVKSLDDGDSLNQTTANNAPGLVSNPFDLRADKGLATYDVRNLAVANAIYELPFGRGKSYANSFSGVTNGFVSGWSVASIVTVQSGFPFTPQLSIQPLKQQRQSQSCSSIRESRFFRAGGSRKTQSVV